MTEGMMLNWHAVNTKPRCEQQVRSFLQQERGIECYLPMWRDPRAPIAARRLTPFLPGYLFARADLDLVGKWALHYAPGVRALVQVGDEPACFDARALEAIELRLREMEHELVDAAGERLVKGDVVRITSGLLRDYEVIFDSRLSAGERVRIFVHFMSNPAWLEIDRQFIEKKRGQRFDRGGFAPIRDRTWLRHSG
jgi:hypothetical protein